MVELENKMLKIVLGGVRTWQSHSVNGARGRCPIPGRPGVTRTFCFAFSRFSIPKVVYAKMFSRGRYLGNHQKSTISILCNTITDFYLSKQVLYDSCWQNNYALCDQSVAVEEANSFVKTNALPGGIVIAVSRGVWTRCGFFRRCVRSTWQRSISSWRARPSPTKSWQSHARPTLPPPQSSKNGYRLHLPTF